LKCKGEEKPITDTDNNCAELVLIKAVRIDKIGLKCESLHQEIKDQISFLTIPLVIARYPLEHSEVKNSKSSCTF
jgi:hypothetical protein